MRLVFVSFLLLNVCFCWAKETNEVQEVENSLLEQVMSIKEFVKSNNMTVSKFDFDAFAKNYSELKEFDEEKTRVVRIRMLKTEIIRLINEIKKRNAKRPKAGTYYYWVFKWNRYNNWFLWTFSYTMVKHELVVLSVLVDHQHNDLRGHFARLLNEIQRVLNETRRLSIIDISLELNTLEEKTLYFSSWVYEVTLFAMNLDRIFNR